MKTSTLISDKETVSDAAKRFFLLPPSRSEECVVDLLGFSQGPIPVDVYDNLVSFAHEWEEKGPGAWNEIIDKDIFLAGNESEEERQRLFGWWGLPEIIGDRFVAPVLGAPHGTCIMVPNVTLGMQQILSCMELNQAGRRRVVTTDWEFPAVGHTLENFNRRFSGYSSTLRNEVELEIVRVSTDSGFDEERMISEINERTALVVFSHVGFLRGELVQSEAIKKIVNAAHKHGALVAVDGYHAIGSIVIDVLDLGVDLYLGGFLKELCGSTGNGFLYVREGLELTPTCGGWLGDAESFEFNEKPKPHPNIRRRFLSGTTPIAPFYHGVEGIKFFLRFGMEAIVEDLRTKALCMIRAFAENGLDFVSPIHEKHASILIILKIDEADKLVEYLVCRGILVDARKNTYLRMSPHVYTSSVDIERAINAILAAIQTGTYKNP